MTDEDEIPPTKRWARRPRLKGFPYRGDHAYHVVFNTAGHRNLLVGDFAEAVVRSLTDAGPATSFDLLVYMVMPDHVHALIQALDPTASAVRFVQRCKQAPGFIHKRQTGNDLWQRSFYDRIVRRNDDAREIAAYILDNPVRAGLLPAGGVWRYSGGTLMESRERHAN